MSDSTANPTPAAAADKGDQRRPRTLMQRVVRATVLDYGARIGLAWLGILVIGAVFGPFIASSHPIAMKVGGEWSSPLLKHLSAADVTLLVAFFAAVPLFFIKAIKGAIRFWIWVAVIIAATVITWRTIEPPTIVVYDKYREMQARGEIESIIRAPIPYSPNDRLRDRSDTEASGPFWSGAEYNHWLGQTEYREDVASRMIHASRIALAIGIISTSIAGTIGILIGGVMGYFAGIIDLIGMRLVEIFEFIPQLFLLLMFVAFFPGDYPEILPGIKIQRIYMIMVVIGLTSWSSYARFIRAEFLKLRKQDFVLAAEALGLPLWSVLFRHMLPNGLTPSLVRASFGVAAAILSEAILSFLGLGLVEEPSWGQMLNQATRGATIVWWIAVFPGLAIFLTVLAYNLIGEALRDAIDPYVSQRTGSQA